MTAVASAPAIRALRPDVPARAQPIRTIRLGLAGCGVVGSALARLLHESADAIGERHGVRVEIVRALVRDARRTRDVPLRAAVFTSDVDEFLAEDVDVIVEAIGGSGVAGAIARAALGRGTRLITANKELVAAAGASLAELGRAAGATLDFGAAVGGSVPVISTLRDLLGTAAPVSVRGILNGTSNYVLSQLERGSDYPAALAAACRRGLAEADCTRDMDGSDSAAKLAIIAWVSFGVDPSTLPVRRIGLLPEPARFVRHASALGGRVRLIAECARVADGGIACAVQPAIVSLDSSFGRTELEDNLVEVDLGWSGPLAVSGPGAGGGPTATSLLSDLLSPGISNTPGGRGHRAVAAGDDPRAHSWLLAAGLSAAELARTVEARGIALRSAGGLPGDSHVVTRPVPWATLHPLIDALAARDAGPLVARVELPVAGRSAA